MLLHVSSTVVLITRRSKLYYTASGIITLCRWPSDVHRLREEYNKRITKQVFCALSWSVTKIILRCTVSKKSKFFALLYNCQLLSFY